MNGDSDSWLLAMHRTALCIADQTVVETIEGAGGGETDPAGQRWFDLRPLIDSREHCGELIDINSEHLAYAFARQLIEQHPQHPHLVRITRMPV